MEAYKLIKFIFLISKAPKELKRIVKFNIQFNKVILAE